MHTQTHFMSGWCLGNCFPLGPRERLFCIVVATFPDLDGLSRLAGQEAYWDWHHVLLHNLVVGLLVAAVLALFSSRRLLALPLYVGLFHLHLAMDYFGAGPGWGLAYWWPFSATQIMSWDWWEFFSWQNVAAGLSLLGWTVLIAVWKKRTPLELVMPSLDRKLSRRPTPTPES